MHGWCRVKRYYIAGTVSVKTPLIKWQRPLNKWQTQASTDPSDAYKVLHQLGSYSKPQHLLCHLISGIRGRGLDEIIPTSGHLDYQDGRFAIIILKTLKRLFALIIVHNGLCQKCKGVVMRRSGRIYYFWQDFAQCEAEMPL